MTILPTTTDSVSNIALYSLSRKLLTRYADLRPFLCKSTHVASTSRGRHVSDMSSRPFILAQLEFQEDRQGARAYGEGTKEILDPQYRSNEPAREGLAYGVAYIP